MQCMNCYRLGRMARGCKFEKRCRKTKTDCVLEDEAKCLNCLEEIAKGATLNAAHLVTEHWKNSLRPNELNPPIMKHEKGKGYREIGK